ncbi:hypothetical protein OG217_03490 [Streptomyces sp. NBC_01023]|nr:hypothetical protein OG217_03490 [Streptomyces sp. NBC_01023]
MVTWRRAQMVLLSAQGMSVAKIAEVSCTSSPHPTTKKGQRVGTWAAANNVEIAYTLTDSSWLNRIDAQFAALRYFTLDVTDEQ